jgi:integrase
MPFIGHRYRLDCNERVRLAESLGIMTCQRASDLVRMGPDNRSKNGIWCRPIKTKQRRKSFWIPLSVNDAIVLDGWSQAPMMFTASRWKSPIPRHRHDLYPYSPKGVPYNPTSLRARWIRWLNRTADGIELCDRWRTWISQQIKKYDWEIDASEVKYPTIHGLRGTGILARRALGHDIAQISNDVGMSRQMVEHGKLSNVPTPKSKAPDPVSN